MMIFSSSKVFFVLFVSFCVVEGTLTPGDMVSVDCGSAQTFSCRESSVPIGWNITGLNGINIPGPFLARNAAKGIFRLTTTDNGEKSQVGVSAITISGFSKSDNGGIIQCIDNRTNNTIGIATISVGLRAPANVVAKAETCKTVSLQWTQPSGPSSIIISVNCTPYSRGCAECTTNPCTISHLTPRREYVFTVTLNSKMCGASMNTVGIRRRDLRAPTNVVATVRSCETVTLQWDQPSEPSDITTSVNCTPPSPGCAECTTSPCNITGLNPSTEYEFSVTLNSGGCRTRMNTATARTMELTAHNLSAAMESCNSITLQWDQPSEAADITTSVSCTPQSPGCAECTTSPCTITGLTPSTEYEFTVTLNSVGCRASMNSKGAKTKGLGAPTNIVAELDSCDTSTVVLEWTQPSEPADITTSASCTPPSPGCAECTTSPCNITGLNLNSEYEFTVTLNSSVCATSTNTTTDLKIDDRSCVTPTNTRNVSTSPGPLAALVVLVLLIPLIYPLGVLVARVCCFRDKSYCEVFWCCGCCRKDKSPRCHSTELMKSPHPREEVEHQNMYKGKHIRFVTDGKQNKDEIGNKQEHVVTYETVEQLEDNDGDVITDETVQQQGNEDGITYATLDFSGHRKGNINVVHSITEEVTYAAV